MKALQCLIFGFAFMLCSCKVVKFRPCETGEGKTTAVDITPCDKEPCPLIKGGNSTISITFTPAEEVTAITAVVHGIIGGIPIPFGLANSNGCKDSGIVCPVKSGAKVKYVVAIPVKSIYPSISLIVKFELQDQNNKDVSCIELPVHLQ